jgi:serine/threonine protein phosphatase 1
LADRLAFIGDIHADSIRLSRLLPKLDRRKLIFLGDYVDHGPDSHGVIKILLEIASHEPSPIFLSGNHEIGLLAFLSERLSFLEYAWMGGLSTIQSYVGKAKENEFLSNCKPFFETDIFVASHAGLNPDRPKSRDVREIVLGRHSSLFRDGVRLDKLVICGHYLQSTQAPYLNNGVACLNTGCGTIGGPLTALLYPEMTILQV